MGLREQSINDCFPEFVFQFYVVQVLVGLRKQFINNVVFPTGPVLLVLIITIIILITIIISNFYHFSDARETWVRVSNQTISCFHICAGVCQCTPVYFSSIMETIEIFCQVAVKGGWTKSTKYSMKVCNELPPQHYHLSIDVYCKH